MSLFEIILTLALSWGRGLWGTAIYRQKGTWFLAGWNTMPREQKEACNREAMCHLLGRCVVFCGVGVFLLLYGSFNDSDRILCAGLGLIGVMVLLSILVPKLNPKKYRK